MAKNETLTDIEQQIAALQAKQKALRDAAQKDAEAIISAAGKIGINLPEAVLIGALLKANELVRANPKSPEVEALREAGAKFLGKQFRRSKVSNATAARPSDESQIGPNGSSSDTSAAAPGRKSSDESRVNEGEPEPQSPSSAIRYGAEEAQGGTLV